MQASDASGRRPHPAWPLAALLCLVGPGLRAQQPPLIRVPVRLVSVPVLALGADHRPISNLTSGDFRLFDNDEPRQFTLDSGVTPLSVVIAVQANQEVRDFLPLVARIGSALDALLVGESGESAVLVYGDEVTLAKPFGEGDLTRTLRGVSSAGFRARATDAAVRGLAMLRQRSSSRTRVLLMIGQPADHGSEYDLDALRRDAERDSVIVHSLALPQAGKSFVGDTFSLRGLSSHDDRGGFVVGADLTRLIPVLTRTAAAAQHSDPLGMLAGITGGTLLHFRKQTQLEEAIALVGVELRSSYTLSLTPAGEAGYHTLRVELDIPGATAHARPGYWLGSN